MSIGKGNSKATEMTVKCCGCAERCEDNYITVHRSQIKLRATGYKGRFQAYVTCDKCGKDTIISESAIPENIWKCLVKRWLRKS